MESPTFETGIVRVQDGRESDIMTLEKWALSGMLLQSPSNIDDGGGNGSIIARTMKRLRSGDGQRLSAYLDTGLLVHN